MNKKRYFLPCLATTGLSVFSTTADQRMMLGPDVFSQTHFPMHLRRFDKNHQVLDTLSESDLFKRLLERDPRHRTGNRLFLLYGAAGSGKSELMAWLQYRLNGHNKKGPHVVIRISRTELDILHVVKKLSPFLDDAIKNDVIESRWAEMRRKPRTFSKLLVLRALESLLKSDEAINALYFRLIDVIEPHVTRALGIEALTVANGPVDIISKEDFELIQQTSVLPLEIDFEQFRLELLRGFRDYLFDGLNLRDALTLISDRLMERGKRPLFIIDDLVQSINIFATEFLDYFITLDEGNWDAIIGLTPSSFEAHLRSREILERISYLDTFDDRVEKLWLSDQSGTHSYFVDEQNCHELAYLYLEAFREQNEMSCESCPALKLCSTLAQDQILSPFNREALVRLFRGVPAGKGQVRYFVRAVREALEMMIQGKHPAEAIAQFGKVDMAVEGSHDVAAQIAAWYGPLDWRESELQLDHRLLEFFDLQQAQFELSVQPLTSTIDYESENRVHIKDIPSRIAIRDWLAGESSNRELLHEMRKGVAAWVRATVPAEYLHRDHIARPWKALRYRRIEMRISPAISIEDIDEFQGIDMARDVGHVSFWLEKFGESTGREKRALGQKLAADARVAPLIWQAEEYRTNAINAIQDQLGLQLSSLSFKLMVLVWVLGGAPTVCPPGLSVSFWETLAEYGYLNGQRNLLSSEIRTTIEQLFDDSFRLRQNLYDGPKLAIESSATTIDAILDALLTLPLDQLDEDYRLGRQSFKAFLQRIKEIVRIVRQVVDSVGMIEFPKLSPQTQRVINQLYQGHPVFVGEYHVETWEEIRGEAPDIFQQLAMIIVSSWEFED